MKIFKNFFKFLIPAFIAAIVLTGCPGFNTGDGELAAVKNFSKYSGIGVGSVSSSRSVSGARSVTESSNYTLVGELADGSFESITFTTTDGTDSTSYKCTAFNSTDSYIFFTLASSAGSIANFCDSRNEFDNKTYILEKSTGNIYTFDHDIYLGHDTYVYKDHNGVIYVGVYDTDNSETVSSIYRLQVTDGSLSATKLLNISSISNYQDMVADKYNNLFIFNTSGDAIYMINSDNQLTNISGKNLFLAMNYVMYTYDKSTFTGYYSYNGTFVETSANPGKQWIFKSTTSWYCTNCLIKTTDDAYYYYFPWHDSSDDANIIYMMSKDGNTYKAMNFDGGITSQEGYATTFYQTGSLDWFAHTTDRLYLTNGSKIFYVDIESGEKSDYETDYNITKIKTDSTGNVYFTGLSSNLDEVSGTIDNDGNLSTEIESSYTIYYYSSL